jgi:hypothetical protein
LIESDTLEPSEWYRKALAKRVETCSAVIAGPGNLSRSLAGAAR